MCEPDRYEQEIAQTDVAHYHIRANQDLGVSYMQFPDDTEFA